MGEIKEHDGTQHIPALSRHKDLLPKWPAFRFSRVGLGNVGILLLLNLRICVFSLLSLTSLWFSLVEGIVSRNGENKGDEDIVGGSEEGPDSRETMSVLSLLILIYCVSRPNGRWLLYPCLNGRGYLNEYQRDALFLEGSID